LLTCDASVCRFLFCWAFGAWTIASHGDSANEGGDE
jgi:hypothetical protein